MDRYIFPAVFEPGERKGYTVTFPDLPGCITEGDNMEEALHMAKEALELHLYGMEEDSDILPFPTPPENLKVPENSFVSLIEIWMPVIRDEMQNKAVKKTLTIPKWLNDVAEKNHINFSQVLQSALKEYLGLTYKETVTKTESGDYLCETEKKYRKE
jgi:predicted RNase H-like HicB family nuclease